MKQSYSNLLRKMLIAIYQPIVTRIELFRATRMWQKESRQPLPSIKNVVRLVSTCSTTSRIKIGRL